MSSRDLARAARISLALAASLALAGCFRPLYGPTASGEKLQDVLAAIEVEKVVSPAGQERIGHYLRSELIFDLDGSGTPHPKRYKLTLDTAETIQPVSVDTASGRADAALLNGAVKFDLKNAAGKSVFAGIARANATYQRDQQRFASVRAARDADTPGREAAVRRHQAAPGRLFRNLAVACHGRGQGGDVDRAVASRRSEVNLLLFYGPDAGRVAERARAAAQAAVTDRADPFQLIRIDGDSLAEEPTRLIEEASTFGMFGGSRAIWVRPTGRNIAGAVSACLDVALVDTLVVVEAGDLAKNSPLRVACEGSPRALALPCYADEGRERLP
ncbi:hypothetical protein JNW90_31690 [Micromonospora sp. STR1s_5]|nr:hypothetical protein [Micromonospora sp. STR1s_5]